MCSTGIYSSPVGPFRYPFAKTKAVISVARRSPIEAMVQRPLCARPAITVALSLRQRVSLWQRLHFYALRGEYLKVVLIGK